MNDSEKGFGPRVTLPGAAEEAVGQTLRPKADTSPGTPRPKSGRSHERARIHENRTRLADTYEILSLLGSGGMGQVYEAQDHSLNRRVAIKVAWPESGGNLAKEARALAAFNHPSLLKVFCLGKHDGADFVVMERITGVSLEDRIQMRLAEGATFSVEEVCSLMAEVADGLSEIHRAGIAHRDVKPENIMLTPNNRVVLMDFGLVLAEAGEGDRRVMAGSPAYMAPEALAHDVRPGAAPMVDIYALGVVMFRLLTDQYPRKGNSVAELFREHRKPVPKPGALRTGLPELLEDLVVECMAFEPTERPHGAESVAWRLRNLPEGARRRSERVGFDVLVVDDDKDVARIVAHYVRKELGDVRVMFAHDGETALDLVRKRAPDLLLLDLHMPSMNGLEVVMALRGEGVAENTSVIVVSAAAQNEDIQLLRQFGVRHVVTKDHLLEPSIGRVLSEMFGGAQIIQTTRPSPSSPSPEE